jgi:DNA-binding SARP family transcriptional activator/tetratricopeptide (TPR) repeat protein
MLSFGVLGPLEVDGKDSALPVKQRVMLASLLLSANRVVSLDGLIGALWDEAPPPSARITAQGHLKRLRQNLGPQAGGRIITRDPGYLIEAGPDELDLHRFTRLRDRAKLAAVNGDLEGAAELYRDALALWRGDPLADVPSPVLHRTEVPRLVELRLRTVELRADAELRLGRPGDLVAELQQLSRAEPLREGLHTRLMLALYLCGRQGEALATFRAIDRRLRTELGISPGPELDHLHQRILAADPALSNGLPFPPDESASPASPQPVPGRAADDRLHPVKPAQLPGDTADFTGRDNQVKMLCDLLTAQPVPQRPGSVVICAIAGMAGIGKTALAVHVAHQVQPRFPDGQLYVTLRGAVSALKPAEVLLRLLRDLGDLDPAIPAGEAERAARYRSLLAGKKVLIVLDDAQDAAQVRPLLPGSAGCAVIVTSRAAPANLAGAVQLSLDVLSSDEARDLFAEIVGPPRAAAAPEATAAVLACCSGLPLAVRIAAARLASRPAWSIAHLATRLADERGRLAELAVGDMAVRASFAVSYDALPGASPDSADPAWVFRLLGLPEMAELSLPAVVALAGKPAAQVASALETLADAHLAQSPVPDRYRLHDLLRRYSAELARQVDGQEERDAAISRLLRWYAVRAVAAARTLTPSRDFPLIIPEPAKLSALGIADPAAALSWFEAEQANLAIAARLAASLGQHDIAVQIQVAMWEFFVRTSHAEDCLALSQVGVASARLLGDDAALSYALMALGWAYGMTQRQNDAALCLTEALRIRRRTGDRIGETLALGNLAVNLNRQGRFEEAIGCQRAALDILAQIGEQHSPRACMLLNNLADTLRCLNRYDEALVYLEQAVALGDDAGDRFGTAITATTLGQTFLGLGRYEDAVSHCQRALGIQSGTAPESFSRADALCTLASALAALGRRQEARETWLIALPLLDRLRDPRATDVRDQVARARAVAAD